MTALAQVAVPNGFKLFQINNYACRYMMDKTQHDIKSVHDSVRFRGKEHVSM